MLDRCLYITFMIMTSWLKKMNIRYRLANELAKKEQVMYVICPG